MNIKILDWDSQFFGFKVGEISAFSSQPMEIENKEIQFIQTKSEKDIEPNILGFEKKYQEAKVIFAKELQETHNIGKDILDFDDVPLAKEKFFLLAYESGKYSRYKQDPNFAEAKFRELYEAWVQNSINKSFATKIFYIADEHKHPKAFVTLKVNETTAHIGLISALPEYQGEGLGSALLKQCENFCVENGVKTLHIPTQLENVPACNFYKKMGYHIDEILYIKHFWREDFSL